MRKILQMPAAFYQEHTVEAGCDEAGRGCLAGPVFAAAVILPTDFFHPDLNDSKQLSAARRERLRPIIEKEALAWAVTPVSPAEIDEVNILWASVIGMQRSVDKLAVRPELILVDGNKFRPYQDPTTGSIIPHKCIVHGDALFASISAASILAKTHRDEYMKKAALEYPEYGWDRNMGYPTAEHRRAIEKFGPCPLHRRSFALLPEPTLF